MLHGLFSISLLLIGLGLGLSLGFGLGLGLKIPPSRVVVGLKLISFKLIYRRSVFVGPIITSKSCSQYLLNEMLHDIFSISLFLMVVRVRVRDPSLKTRYGFEVIHIMKDYKYLHVTNCSQLLRLNLVHNFTSGNAP